MKSYSTIVGLAGLIFSLLPNSQANAVALPAEEEMAPLGVERRMTGSTKGSTKGSKKESKKGSKKTKKSCDYFDEEDCKRHGKKTPPSSMPTCNPSSTVSCINNFDDLNNTVANATYLAESLSIVLCPGTFNFTEAIDLSNKAIHLRCQNCDVAAGDCVLNGNDANQIFIAGARTGANFDLEFTDITFTKGSSSELGGAVELRGNESDPTSVALFDNCTFTDNVASKVSIRCTSKNQNSGSFAIANNPLYLH
jgi:hypothetical protein